jgi:hypothetical protein
MFTGMVALWFAASCLCRWLLAQARPVRGRAHQRLGYRLCGVWGSAQEFAVQEFVGGTVNLIDALLAFVVACSELSGSLRSGAAPTPSGKSGRPNPTH